AAFSVTVGNLTPTSRRIGPWLLETESLAEHFWQRLIRAIDGIGTKTLDATLIIKTNCNSEITRQPLLALWIFPDAMAKHREKPKFQYFPFSGAVVARRDTEHSDDFLFGHSQSKLSETVPIDSMVRGTSEIP